MPHGRQPGRRAADRRSPLRDQGRPRRGARRLRARLARMALDRRREARRDPAQGGRAAARARRSRSPATMTQEQGKPVGEAKLEVLASAQLFDWYAEDAKRDYGRTLVRPAGQLSRVIRQPVGPTATFTPWNFPIYLLAKKVSAALAAGCTVISRPPHETPGLLHRAVPRARRRGHSRTASPSWSTATAVSSAKRSSPAGSSARSASPARPTSASTSCASAPTA